MRDLLAEWELTPDGEPHGASAVVLPVRTSSGEPASLKVGPARPASALEHLALQHWHGNGAVRLLRADPRRDALLLERLRPDEDLSGLWDVEACEVVASFYERLHVPAGPQFTTLSSSVARWVEGLRELPRDAGIPRRMVEQAISLGRDLAVDDDTDGRLIHTDLHFHHVLAAEREPWLVIGPRPLSGDPHFEVAPLLWHRWDELAGDVRRGVRARFHAAVDAAGLDEERARDWVVVRMVVDAMEAAGDDDEVTRCVTIAKSVQD